jgi:hypothetical protein
MGREHRIPLVRIRCMTDRCYRQFKKIWQAPVMPITDINEDRMVNFKDLLIFAEHWLR